MKMVDMCLGHWGITQKEQDSNSLECKSLHNAQLAYIATEAMNVKQTYY